MASGLDSELVEAVDRGDTETVCSLLSRGADPNARDDPDRPLPHAQLLEWRLRGCKPWQTNDSALLLAVGADHTIGGFVPVFRAENTAIVRALVNAGADVNCVDASGLTPLMYGVMSRRPTTVETLIELGADPNIVNSQGTNALLTACHVNAPASIARILLDAGTDPHAVHLRGFTALLHAVYHGNIETTRALLEHGADANIKSRCGEDVLRIARLDSQADIARLLVQYGATEPPRKRKSRAGGRRM